MAAWSRLEIDALVADYFAMFASELRGERVNKAAHNRALQRVLGRSHGSIEMKHQNVSAVLRDIGASYIGGYKPLSNYQDMLYDVVVARVGADQSLRRELRAVASASPNEPVTDDILAKLVQAPAGRVKKSDRVGDARRHVGPDAGLVDYVAREARNAALGAKGEEWVLAFERARLLSAGKGRLADRVEHVAKTHGPSAGYDILSFEPSGKERLVEVKTTAGPIQTAFFVSANEVETSREHAAAYHLYRPFNFNRDPRLFIVKGRLDRTFDLEASIFRARVA